VPQDDESNDEIDESEESVDKESSQSQLIDRKPKNSMLT